MVLNPGSSSALTRMVTARGGQSPRSIQSASCGQASALLSSPPDNEPTMTFSHPLARSAKVFTAHCLDGAEEKILAVATTLELDPKGEHYKKRFVEKLSAAALDYVRKSDHVTAFVLIT